jgi:hypothetical protein
MCHEFTCWCGILLNKSALNLFIRFKAGHHRSLSLQNLLLSWPPSIHHSLFLLEANNRNLPCLLRPSLGRNQGRHPHVDALVCDAYGHSALSLPRFQIGKKSRNRSIHVLYVIAALGRDGIAETSVLLCINISCLFVIWCCRSPQDGCCLVFRNFSSRLWFCVWWVVLCVLLLSKLYQHFFVVQVWMSNKQESSCENFEWPC